MKEKTNILQAIDIIAIIIVGGSLCLLVFIVGLMLFYVKATVMLADLQDLLFSVGGIIYLVILAASIVWEAARWKVIEQKMGRR
jgi:hypothetical protein